MAHTFPAYFNRARLARFFSRVQIGAGRALLVHRDALDAALTPAGTSQPLTLVRRRA